MAKVKGSGFMMVKGLVRIVDPKPETLNPKPTDWRPRRDSMFADLGYLSGAPPPCNSDIIGILYDVFQESLIVTVTREGIHLRYS